MSLPTSLWIYLTAIVRRLRDSIDSQGRSGPPIYQLAAMIARLPPFPVVVAKLAPWFPHIDLRRLSWADLLRLPLQVLWLLLIKPPQQHARPIRRRLEAVQRAFGWFWQLGLEGIDRLGSAGAKQVRPGFLATGISRLLDRAVNSRLVRDVRGRQLAFFLGGCLLLVSATVPLDRSGQLLLAAVLLMTLLPL